MTPPANAVGKATKGISNRAAKPLTRFIPASAITRSPLDLTSACQLACSSDAARTAAATSACTPSRKNFRFCEPPARLVLGRKHRGRDRPAHADAGIVPKYGALVLRRP